MGVLEPVWVGHLEKLALQVFESNQAMGKAAAAEAASILEQTLRMKSYANLILAAANSQLTFLEALRRETGIDWSRVNIFHMDEYIGLDEAHPARFSQFLKCNLLDFINPAAFFSVLSSMTELEVACREYENLLRQHPADLCVMGIGENGHLAFNDPPYANFQDPNWIKVVRLDPRSRVQQVYEGHFSTLVEVPTQAVTMTIPALLAATRILVVVPEARKAEAIERALLGQIDESCPASILRTCSHANLFLDRDSAFRVMSFLK